MQKNYNPAVDLLRIFSILAVILIHTSTRILEATHMDLIHHQDSLFLNQISRFAVPLFFMISGFVLELSYKNNFLEYIQKRISKIFIPYLFWSALYYFFIYTQHSDNFFQALLSGSASYQLYFIPALLVLYFVFPLLHKLYSLLANKLVLLILAILQIRLLYLDYHLQGLTIYYPLNIALLNYLVFILGMIAFNTQEQILKFAKKFWPLLLIITIGAGFFVFWEGLKNYYSTYNFQYYYSQWRPSVLIYTLSIASLGYYVFSKIRFSSQLIKSVSNLSFAVFFVHIIILETIWKYWHVSNDLLLFTLVTGGSFALAYVLHKIPHLAKVTG